MRNDYNLYQVRFTLVAKVLILTNNTIVRLKIWKWKMMKHFLVGQCSALMICKQDRKCLWDAKAIPGEAAVSQPHLILTDMKVRGAVKAQRQKFEPRRKVWRLNDENV